MSQSSNHVEWCLKKAEKEIEEGKKHRGLIKIEADLMEIRNHVDKAEHNLKAISFFDSGGYSDWSMSAVFYCIYHCFLAIGLKFGYESRNQECTISLIKFLKETGKINIDDKFIAALEVHDKEERLESNIIEKREHYTYGTTTSADKEEIDENVFLCTECLVQTRKIVFKGEE